MKKWSAVQFSSTENIRVHIGDPGWPQFEPDITQNRLPKSKPDTESGFP